MVLGYDSEIKGQPVGPLPEDEKIVLIKSEGIMIKSVQIVLIVTYIAIFVSLIVAAFAKKHSTGITVAICILLIDIPLYMLFLKERARVKTMKSSSLEVYRLQGTLNCQYQNMGRGGGCYFIKIDDFTLPAIITVAVGKQIETHNGQLMSAEFIPEVSKNRRLYDSSGWQYNFLKSNTPRFQDQQAKRTKPPIDIRTANSSRTIKQMVSILLSLYNRAYVKGF